MDYIIFSNKNDLQEGMYGQTLTWLLEILHDLEKTNKINDTSRIMFDVNALQYNNIIPTFIIAKNEYTMNDLKNPVLLNIKPYKSSKTLDFDFDMNSFQVANRIWNKYFVLSQGIEDNIPKIDSENTLGVHFRGTDKTSDANEANPISQDEFIIIVKDYLSNHKEIQTIYCCSDEASFITRMKAEFNHLNIIDYDQKRATDNSRAFHKNIPNDNKAQHTCAAIVDMIALSRCKTVLKTSSAMSAFSKIINPNVQLLTCCAMKQRWFPTGVVDVYLSSDIKVNNILKRTMVGHNY